ncbi:MAG: hypothetical protein K8H90_09155, partial [Thermoanaerobaculia bacterium]|nr:hypothetical protein [Thermoanaerobaculia bacterium]
MSTIAKLLARTAASCALAALVATPAAADDRDLLRATQDDPYVFILLDLSGSMNWQPAGDAWAPASADDPNSKFYQAKSALFRVLQATDDINFGFATFNHDETRARQKNYVYRLAPGQETPDWVTDSDTQLNWPSENEPITFGSPGSIDGGNNTLSSCSNGGPNLNQAGVPYLEARGEINRFPKLGFRGSTTTTDEWFRSGVSGTTYRFTASFTRSSGDVGDDSIVVAVRIRRWGTGSGSCDSAGDSPTYNETELLRFDRYYVQDNRGVPFAGSSEFLMWERDGDVGPSGEPAGFFDSSIAVEYYPSPNETPNTNCNGWDPNSDSSSDDYGGENVRQPTQDDPLNRACATCLDRGDVIPLDWNEDAWLTGPNVSYQYGNRDLILTRLAPNLINDGLAATPDFRSAPYFQDTRSNGILNLRDDSERPLVAVGGTPIGASMASFRSWYNTWRSVAAAEDNRFGCKKVTLLILTDGDETCNSATYPRDVARNLLDSYDVETYVIGFGLPLGGGNTLVSTTCAGGGQAPDPDGQGPLPPPICTTSPTNDHLFLPNNEEELVNALVTTFSSIKETSAAFASAAAPTLQANVEDKV